MPNNIMASQAKPLMRKNKNIIVTVHLVLRPPGMGHLEDIVYVVDGA